EGLGHDAVVGPPAALFAGDQAGVDEFFHVVTHSGLGDAELFGQVTSADFLATLGIEMRQQPQPGWVPRALSIPATRSACSASRRPPVSEQHSASGRMVRFMSSIAVLIPSSYIDVLQYVRVTSFSDRSISI